MNVLQIRSSCTRLLDRPSACSARLRDRIALLWGTFDAENVENGHLGKSHNNIDDEGAIDHKCMYCIIYIVVLGYFEDITSAKNCKMSLIFC